MEIDSGLRTIKYSDRIPPLDLSNVSVCATQANEIRWNKIHPGYTPQRQKQSKHANNNGNNNNNNINKYQHNNNSKINQNHLKQHGCIHFGSDGLPIDPRDWTRADVWKWLVGLAVSEGIDVSPDLAQKFPMNGKALCLMSLDMYLSRVPVGGKMLYRDFRVRLARAISL